MKRTLAILTLTFAFAMSVQSLRADTLVGPGGAFQPWTAAVLGPANAPQYGGPYWNNASGDGKAANIGWCLVGTGGCAIKSPPGAIKYYGAGLNAVPNMSFQSNGIAVTVSVLGLLTNQKGGNNGVDYFGWYSINADGSIGAKTILFSTATATTNTNVTFMPTGNYGIFLENVQGNGAADYFWFSTSSKDYGTGPGATGGATTDTRQHFAIFSGQPGEFFVGVDDTNAGTGSDSDFNDLVLRIVNVPEPSSTMLLVTGAAVCGFLASRRKRVLS